MPCEVISSSGNLISVRITGELKKAELDYMQAVATEFMKRAWDKSYKITMLRIISEKDNNGKRIEKCKRGIAKKYLLTNKKNVY